MLQKIVYDVVFNPSKKWSRTGDGMIVIRASQGRKSVDIPTNIFCQSKQFSDGYINSLHPQFDGLNAMINQIMLDIQSTEIEADMRKAFPKDRPIIIPEAVPLPPEIEFCEAEEVN